MVNPSWPRLTRGQLVTIIGDYYAFLTTFYMPFDAIKYPPPGGWPNITAETTDYLGKSPLVIDLIKHLPYIDNAMSLDHHEHAHDIHYKSEVTDYSVHITPENDAQDLVTMGEESLQEWYDRMQEELDDEEESDDEDMNWDDNWYNGDNPDKFKMSNMITLALGSESGGRHIILDVFKGDIYEDVNQCNLLSSVPVEGFFDDLRKKFEKLELMPTGGEFYEAQDGGVDVDEQGQAYRKVWREHGWPGKDFKKERALEAIQELRKRLASDD